MLAKFTFEADHCYQHNIIDRLNEALDNRNISDDQIISVNEVGTDIVVWYKEVQS